jgi:hypothetical protein
VRGFRAIGKGVSSKVQVKGQGFERGEEIYSRIVKRIWVSKKPVRFKRYGIHRLFQFSLRFELLWLSLGLRV